MTEPQALKFTVSIFTINTKAKSVSHLKDSTGANAKKSSRHFGNVKVTFQGCLHVRHMTKYRGIDWRELKIMTATKTRASQKMCKLGITLDTTMHLSGYRDE